MDISVIAEWLPALLAFAVAGLAVGILSGMLGIGGGTVLVPLFKLGFGMPALGATATSMFTIIPTSASGFVAHLRGKTCVPRFGVAAGIGGAVTSPVGVWLASISPEWATMVAAAAVIAYSASTMLVKAVKLLRKQRAKASADVAAEGSSGTAAGDANLSAPQMASGWKPVLLACVIGLVAGVLSGYVGVGGGFLIVPMFMQLLNMPMRLTSGTSLIAVMILAVPGTVAQAMLGNVQWAAGICVAIGAIPGAVIGSKLMKRVPELTLRFIFGAFLLVAAILLVVDQVM